MNNKRQQTNVNSTKRFKGPVKYSEAKQTIADYRKGSTDPLLPLGVYYEAKDIKDYVDNIFPRLTAAQDKWIAEWKKQNPESDFDPANYTWQVGFYWILNKDKDDKRMKPDFLVVPSLVSIKNHKEVIDYFNEIKNPFLDRREKPSETEQNTQQDDIEDFSFNTGNMFP